MDIAGHLSLMSCPEYLEYPYLLTQNRLPYKLANLIYLALIRYIDILSLLEHLAMTLLHALLDNL